MVLVVEVVKPHPKAPEPTGRTKCAGYNSGQKGEETEIIFSVCLPLRLLIRIFLSQELDFSRSQNGIKFTGLLGLFCYVNDPSAGSPTETLLRLLLPLDEQICTISIASSTRRLHL